MIELILGALILFFVQTVLPPLFRYYIRKDPDILGATGARDNPPPATTTCLRAERALSNIIEAMVLFLPVALLAALKPGVDQAAAIFGAQLFLAARVAYVPVYLLGIPLVRTLVWVAGHAGIVLIAMELI